MRVALWIGGIIVALAAAYIGVLLLIGGDVDTDRYATLREARADRLFMRGWLPDILPPSARKIRTSNDFDLNASEGEFRFASTDYRAFASRLRPYSSLPGRWSGFDGYVKKMQRRGYQAGVFSDEESTWLFVCEPKGGRCEYKMWLERE